MRVFSDLKVCCFLVFFFLCFSGWFRLVGLGFLGFRLLRVGVGRARGFDWFLGILRCVMGLGCLQFRVFGV